MRQAFPDDANYRSVIRSLLLLHRLWNEGKGESPEADAIRDAMDDPWHLLSEAERKRVWGLSQDLNSFSQSAESQGQFEMKPQAQVMLVEATEARQRGEWDRALDTLRECSPSIAPALLFYLRGAIWSDAGDHEVAAAFFAHAAKLEPENSTYRALSSNGAAVVNPAEMSQHPT